MVVSAITIGFICLGSDFIFLWVGNSFADSYFKQAIKILIAEVYAKTKACCFTLFLARIA